MNPHQKPQEDVVGLLPCPFCGGEADRYTAIASPGFENRQVYCKSCGASAFDLKWQQRTPSTYEAGRRDMREAAGWQPIETAPRDGSWVMLTGGDIEYGWYWNTKPRAVSGFYIGEDDEQHACWQFAYYDSGYYGAYENPTHWMPLPTEPLGGENPND